MPGELVVVDAGFALRPLGPGDLDAHLEAVDEEQIRWLWEPGEGDTWRGMTSHDQREHLRNYLTVTREGFGPGPKWVFALDAPGASYVVYIDCDLANPHVPRGEANISYACHPLHRRQGYTARAVGLVCEFLRRETSATTAYIVVEAGNLASRGVARSVGARELDSFVDDYGRSMIRHVLPL